MKHNDLLKWTSVIAYLTNRIASVIGVATLAVCCAFSSSMADDLILIDNLPLDTELLNLEDLESLDAPVDIDALADDTDQRTVPNLPDAVMPDTFKAKVETAAPQAEPEPVKADPNVKVNLVEINEYYYLLEYDKQSNTYLRSLTQEAQPGDLIEIEVIATNLSDEVVKEIEMVNTIPSGQVTFLPESVTLDSSRGFYRISSTGQTFFSPDTEIAAGDIHFLKWQIFSLGVSDTLTLSYQIKIGQ